jgi:hypothetical protein
MNKPPVPLAGIGVQPSPANDIMFLLAIFDRANHHKNVCRPLCKTFGIAADQDI